MGVVPSLPENIPLDQYVSTAGQTDFVFTFMIFETENIKVYVNSILKTETVDYVVRKADGGVINAIDDLPMLGGKIVFNSGLSLDDAVSISREIDPERISGFSVAGEFRANTVNGEYTKLFAIQQEFKRDLDRAVRLNDYDASGGNTFLPENRAGKYLAFDQSNNLIVSSGTVGQALVVSSFIETLLDDSTAAVARATLGVQENVITTRGDLIKGSSSNTQERLPLGASNTVLQSNGTDPVWATIASASENQSGLISIATQAGVQAKTNDTDSITPLKLAQATENISIGNTNVITVNATWTKPSNLRYVVVEVIGGGGGGYDGTISVSAGGFGGTSSFGSHCSASGGEGAQTGLFPAAGGNGVNGNINLQGGHAKGHSGGYHGENWSMGGDIPPFGYGGMAVAVAGGRNYSKPPTGFGAGGGGRLLQQAVASAAGAAGGYCKKFIPASQLNGTENVVIGFGGVTPNGGFSSAGAPGIVIVTSYVYN
jgi:hypothetical protein